MASTTFENKLNAAIEEKGYRISPRLGLEDRLARYIELSWIDRGEPLTSDEIDAVVALTMVNNFGAEEIEEPRRSGRVESQELRRSARVASRDNQEDTWQPRRSSRIAATSRNVTATNDNVRVSFATGSQSAGAHPMVRRSQVARR
jgi:hypothetical protein